MKAMNCKTGSTFFRVAVVFIYMTFFSLMGTLTPANAGKNQVVVYTALDQVFSEPVLKSFEKKSGIKVKAVYDIEATKTTGIVNRLIAERKNPQCDVFWNNEVIRTIFLKRKKVLAPYFSALAKSIPERFKDEQGYWTGFSARARILVVNTDSLKAPDWPESIFDLTRPQWKNRVAIANPLFGTTATHAAALFQVLGSEKAKKYFLDLKKNNIAILDGNSVVKDNVGSGAFEAGFTDTDDVNMGILAKLPVKTIFPDQEGIGTLVIPNTVSIIANSPNPENGKHLIDYLLSEAVEQMLAFCPSVQMPLRPTVKTPLDFTGVNQIKAMDVDYEKITDVLDESVQFIQEIFIR